MISYKKFYKKWPRNDVKTCIISFPLLPIWSHYLQEKKEIIFIDTIHGLPNALYTMYWVGHVL